MTIKFHIKIHIKMGIQNKKTGIDSYAGKHLTTLSLKLFHSITAHNAI